MVQPMIDVFVSQIDGEEKGAFPRRFWEVAPPVVRTLLRVVAHF